jgi:hypothetical protein
MAQTKARIGYGTLLKYGDGASPENFEKLAEVRNIDGFGVQRNEVEATHMESPGEAIERVAGLKDGQVVNVTVNMTVDNVDVLKGFVDDGEPINWQLIFPATLPTYSFAAVPLTWKIQGTQPAGLLEVAFGMRITGDII